ncbi:YdcF family protein [Oculatella sp. FACHB-28]|uniref:YdcF family protein n=1 Tax=Cyanophyceae TaxID=3028117 RepID=UPI001684C5EC|nr:MULTISPECIES: YdcF family protein [Cyanophyceae]MBD1866490.1 YdcF family protein [Cyanobacteria bacterium FACHB-471]MBD2057442.1 YdcF family protein [Oculatella sp. FACHB-28]MBD2070490.1 YdcF family protein [Leptolyngbya sp. FACHB-671]
MFELLTRILLWALIGIILWRIFLNVIPRIYLTWLGGLLIFTFVILAFLNPTDDTVGAVWQILSIPLKPLGLSLLLLLSAMRSGIKAVAGNLVLAAALILLFSSLPLTAYWLTSQSERSAEAFATNDNIPALTSAQAIVVLGDSSGLLDSSYRTRTELDEDGISTNLTPRLLYAARLYQEAGSNPLVIVSAGLQDREGEDTNEVQSITNLLAGTGVPSNRIVIDSESAGARTSAEAVVEILEDRGINNDDASVVLVGSAVSIRRASSTFGRLDVAVIPRPTEFSALSLPGSDDFTLRIADFVPSVDALALTTRVVDEYLTSIYYFLRGWLSNPMGI